MSTHTQLYPMSTFKRLQPPACLHAENQAPFSQADAMQLAVVWLSEYL